MKNKQTSRGREGMEVEGGEKRIGEGYSETPLNKGLTYIEPHEEHFHTTQRVVYGPKNSFLTNRKTQYKNNRS